MRDIHSRKTLRNPDIAILCDGEDIFVTVDGVKIAKRGHPDTPHAKTWIALEPGWAVTSSADHSKLNIAFDGPAVQ